MVLRLPPGLGRLSEPSAILATPDPLPTHMMESVNPHAPATVSRDWADCDLFCITGYGTSHSCGWRGRFHEADWDDDRCLRRCPRCRAVSLLGVPTRTPAGDDETAAPEVDFRPSGCASASAVTVRPAGG